MSYMPNILLLLKNLRDNGWHITAFDFHYKEVNYVVLFEDLANLNLVNDRYDVLLTFIDRADETRIFKTKANPYGFDAKTKEFRNYFGIEYGDNLRDIFIQFYILFGNFIPEQRLEITDTITKHNIIQTLSRNDNENINATCCYAVRRNGIHNGNQYHRSIFNSNKTMLIRESLYSYFANDDIISFCYRENDELSDLEIISNFEKSESVNF